jgi:hypothetical protein
MEFRWIIQSVEPLNSFSIRTPSSMPAKAGLSAPTKISRPLEVSAVILPLFLLSFLLARFAAPLFKLLPACAFRQTFGVPCPSCGATRAGLALAQGDLIIALSYNPLFVICLGILFGWSVCRVLEKWAGPFISKRLLKLITPNFGAPAGEKPSQARQRQWLRWLAIGAIAVNWLYLILTSSR